ncbi:hypothetical protein B0T20DRAFT_425556 [Sordaria brevicollis]|uniref:Uncharacterized protein n=1 Tax=Sordaria brevicollis TaxID=83679 RepID=A0AAE0U2R6_SORBR|nr:hypothetical protein B0T20DRAFT_425556 [Sordaria brevicollis]
MIWENWILLGVCLGFLINKEVDKWRCTLGVGNKDRTPILTGKQYPELAGNIVPFRDAFPQDVKDKDGKMKKRKAQKLVVGWPVGSLLNFQHIFFTDLNLEVEYRILVTVWYDDRQVFVIWGEPFTLIAPTAEDLTNELWERKDRDADDLFWRTLIEMQDITSTALLRREYHEWQLCTDVVSSDSSSGKSVYGPYPPPNSERPASPSKPPSAHPSSSTSSSSSSDESLSAWEGGRKEEQPVHRARMWYTLTYDHPAESAGQPYFHQTLGPWNPEPGTPAGATTPAGSYLAGSSTGGGSDRGEYSSAGSP